jgi:hypothetical protein
MDDVLFTELIQNFSEFLLKDTEEFHILLVDGHDSHERYSVLQMARMNNIIIVRFPSHCTHLLQPLDLVYFKLLKVEYHKALKGILNEKSNGMKDDISIPDFVHAMKIATDTIAQGGHITTGAILSSLHLNCE